ncbi:unnamed protein product [Heligmosomoides polygyrus]|uniref:Mlh1_C domain-containing protein n=1 Tax=Heligmosomoides polygyrus TaxID=6339 RepID=A0A183GLV3_HELPZ|nr:unnamed protein product [Heligmosomoides polygyrus]
MASILKDFEARQLEIDEDEQLEVVENMKRTTVFGFGNFGSFKLQEGANILELLHIACFDGDEMEALELLECQSAMLNDYFSIEILRSEEAEDLRGLYLSAIPSSVDGYAPQLEGLPALVKGLVSTVNWDEEEACFEGVSRLLAEFFVIKEEFCSGELLSGLEGAGTSWLAVIRDLLVPRIKSHLVPPDSLKDCVTRLADLHDLYKVFERC